MIIDRLTNADQFDDAGKQGLIDCWVAVVNAGGAVGFPFPPVSEVEVARAVDRLVPELDPTHCVLFRASHNQAVQGWVVLRRGPSALVAHWATVERLQAAPHCRGQGVGTALMESLERYARMDLGLVQLHLAVRGGMGLERYYKRLGWREVGRWPGALRISAADVRDEVLMQKQVSSR